MAEQKTITLKLDPAEHKMMKQAALDTDKTLKQYILDLVVQEIKQRQAK